MGMAAEIHRIVLSSGHVAVIDEADWERECRVGFACSLLWVGRIADRNWRVSVEDHTAYCISDIRIGKASLNLRLHRAVLDAAADQIVDHIDGNGLNCCRSNLRFATVAQNAQNRRPTVGRRLPKGVAFHKASGKYESYIRHEGHRQHLGLFVTVEEASAAYGAAAIQLFGEFACVE